MSNQKISGYQVKDETLTGNQIQNNSIDSVDIKDGVITDTDIASNANIAFSKINIPNNTINGSLLIDNTITSAKILDGTIVDADISSTAAIQGSKIKSASINEYNLATYRFTAKYAGRYLITCGYAYTHHDAGIRSVTIYKNGVNTGRIMTLDSNTQSNVDPVYNYTTTLDLNVNEYIEFFTYQNRGGTLNIYNAWANITKIL